LPQWLLPVKYSSSAAERNGAPERQFECFSERKSTRIEHPFCRLSRKTLYVNQLAMTVKRIDFDSKIWLMLPQS
jgi:hypothetical protein